MIVELVAGCGLGVASLLVGLGLGEASAASDNVNVSRDLTRRNNRITTLNSQRRTVDCKKLCLSTLKKGGSRSGDNDS